MTPYQEKFSVGATVRIVDARQLAEFQRTWTYHHKLDVSQLAFAGRVADVKNVSFYHGGDVLYELDGVPGIWHECCLSPEKSGS